MSAERRGIVTLDYEGSAVPIRFTWAAIDSLGRDGVAVLLERAGSGQAGDMAALARLIEAASAGEISAVDLMSGESSFTQAYVCVLTAWAAAVRSPSGVERDENPLSRLWTSLRTLLGRLWRSVSLRPNSGTRRRI